MKKSRGTSKHFRTRASLETRPQRLKILKALGWRQIGDYWLSPRSGLRFSEQVALDIEYLRGTFKSGYQQHWADEIAA